MAIGAKDRLVGSDATLMKASFGAEVSTGSSNSGVWYKIEKKSANTVFPAGYEVGDLFLGPGTPVTFSATNSARVATFTELVDVTSYTVEFNADEIEVTTLADDGKKYRKGKYDVTGTVEGINRVSEMQKQGSFINRFLRVVDATAGDVATLYDVNGDPLYCQFIIQKDNVTTTETFGFMFAQVELFGSSIGASVGDAQSWSSGLRLVGNDPILYFQANA